MDRWADTVLRVAYTWTGSVHDAQDICQTVLLKMLTSPRRFDEERLERAWVLRVTVNCCKDLHKSAWHRRRAPLEAAANAAVYLPEPEVRARLETPEGRETEDISYSLNATCLEDDDPTDNKISLVVNVTANGDLAGLTLRIPGLWKWEIADKSIFTPIFTGDFAFPISEDMGEDCVTTLDVAGVTAQTKWGPVTLETLELSPLGLRWSYRIDEATAQAAREAEQAAAEEPPAVTALNEDGSETPMEAEILIAPQMTLVLKDGTEMGTFIGFQGQEDGLQVCSGSFPAPVDLAQADHLLWGDTEIPLN